MLNSALAILIKSSTEYKLNTAGGCNNSKSWVNSFEECNVIKMNKQKKTRNKFHAGGTKIQKQNH